MATFASSDLLAMFNALAGRPSSGDALTDAQKYLRLAYAQDSVIEDFAARIPSAMYSHAAYGSTPTLSTSDNQIFTFGTDLNSDASFPVGKVNLYASLSAIPDNPLLEGSDYLWEGTQVRIPNNRTYSGTIYWRGVAPAQQMSATVQPTVTPPPARKLIVYEAVRSYATEGNKNAELAQVMAGEYGLALSRLCLTLKTAQRNRAGALHWTTGLRLANPNY